MRTPFSLSDKHLHLNDRPLAREVRTFLFEDKLYTVVNPSVVESLPTIALAQPETLLAPSLRRALLATKCPELAYAPRNHHFTCNFLERLNCRVNNLPIVEDTQRTTKRWRLKPVDATRMSSLSRCLDYVSDELSDRKPLSTCEPSSMQKHGTID